jgi:hypothetical protein
MSDIVERLRADPLRNFDEAADEIERLRAAHDHQYAVAGTLLREAETAQRENERLRAALVSIARAPDADNETAYEMRKIAREAIRPDKEEGPVAIAYTPKRFFEAGADEMRKIAREALGDD